MGSKNNAQSLKPDFHIDEQSFLEEEVIRESRSNPSAFRFLYEKYFKKVFLFVLRRVGDKDLTADITSQVFLKGLQKIDQFTFRGLPFSSWLLRIAVNECNIHFRTNRRHRLVVLSDAHTESLYEELFGENMMEEFIRKLPDILSALKEGELDLIELRFSKAVNSRRSPTYSVSPRIMLKYERIVSLKR